MNMAERKFILIGDSLAVGFSDPQGEIKLGWAYYFKNELQLSDDSCVISAHERYGFTTEAGGEDVINTGGINTYTNGFLNLLNQVQVAKPSDITDIIVLGGLNDCYSNASKSDIINEINKFYVAAGKFYYNAKVWIGMLGRCKFDTGNSTIKRIRDVVLPAMKSSKCTYITNCEHLCHKYWLYNSNDTIHLTNEYYEEIGRQIAHQFETGIAVCGETVNPEFTHDSGNFSLVNNPPIGQGGVSQNDGIITFYGVKDCCFWVSNNVSLLIDWNDNVTSVHLGNINNNTYYSGVGDNIIPVTGFIGIKPAQDSSDEKFFNFSGILNLNANHVNLDIEAIMTPESYQYKNGCISRICFMYPTVSCSALLG